MMRFTHSAGRVRRAVIAVKVAIFMPVLLAVVALALDTGMLYDRERHAQAAAEAAALAAACDLFTTYHTGTYTDDGKDINGVARAHAFAIAKVNGYPNDGVTANVTVHIPPVSGPYTGRLGYAEVLITYIQPRGFSNIFGTGDLLVGVRAVARGRWEPQNIGIICLDPVSGSSLKLGGGAIAQVPDSSVIVNSTSTSAMYAAGTGPTIQSEHFEITGSYAGGAQGSQFLGPIDTGVPPTPDPYYYLPEPNPAGMPQRQIQHATVIDLGAGYRKYILEPGVYKGGLSFSGKDSVVLMPGIYYMDGGGFKFTGGENCSLVAQEVMLFNGPSKSGGGNDPGADAISITGQASVTWTPPSSGIYQGISFFQARSMETPLSISGQGEMNIKGVLYAAAALVDVSGNGTNFIGNQVVCWQMNFQGNGTFIVPWDPGMLPSIRDLRIVE